jgi:predicted RNA-binding protein YlxR (DUF448 family)
MIATSSITPPSVPMRTCVGCRQVVPQAQLLRLAVVDERLVADRGRRASGRGVYVHAQPDCLRAAGKGGLARSLKRGVSRTELDAIAGVAAASHGSANAVERAPHLAPPSIRTTRGFHQDPPPHDAGSPPPILPGEPISDEPAETGPSGRPRHGAH